MPECWICERAVVSESRNLPLTICRRAGCLPERRDLHSAHRETLKQFAWIALSEDPHRAGGAA